MNKHTYIAHTRNNKDRYILHKVLLTLKIPMGAVLQVGSWCRTEYTATLAEARSVREAFRAFRNADILTEF